MACANHRNANNPTGPVVPPVDVGTKFSKEQLNDFREALRLEILRWRQHAGYTGVGDPAILKPDVANASRINADDLDSLNSELHEFGGVENSAGRKVRDCPAGKDISPIFADLDEAFVDAEKQIRAEDYELLRKNYSKMRMDCICNTDCATNVTPGCCTVNCGCNYSDKRLKREISYC
jgi:hypothetical protein